MDVTLDDLEPVDTGARGISDSGGDALQKASSNSGMSASTVSMDDLEAVEAPDNSVYHEPSGRVLGLPQTLDARESQYLTDKDIDGKNGFYGQVYIGENPPPPLPLPPMLSLTEIPKPSYFTRGVGSFFNDYWKSVIGNTLVKRGQKLQSGESRMDNLTPSNMMGYDYLQAPETDEQRQMSEKIGAEAEQLGKDTLEINRARMKRAGMDTSEAVTLGEKASVILGYGIPSIAVTIGSGGLMNSQIPAMAFFHTLQSGNTYLEVDAADKDKQLTPNEKEGLSYSVANVSAALEGFGGHLLFKSLQESGVGKRIIGGYLSEGTTGAMQNAAEEGILQSADIRDTPLPEVLEGMALQFAVEGFLGGASAGALGRDASKEAKQLGVPEDIANELGRRLAEEYPAASADMLDFMRREISPLAQSDEATKEFTTLMQKFINGEPVKVNDLTETQQELFDKWADHFQKTMPDDRGTAAVEGAWYKQSIARGLDPDQAMTSAKLIGAYSGSAARALNVSPMEWWESTNLDLEVQRTPEEAVASYQEKLDALKDEEPDVLTPEEEAAKADELAGIDKRLNEAKAGTKDVSMKKPIINYLKGLGGIRTDGLVYGELKFLGIDRKSAVGLFNNKDTALRDIDNIPVEEFNRALGVAAQDDGNGYVDRDWLLQALRDEQFGQRMGQERPVTDESFLQALDKAGLDYRTATAEQVYEALGADGDIVVAAADMGVELTPKEVRQVRGIMERNPDMVVQDAIDDFIERSAIMGDTRYQRDGDQAVLPGAEKVTDKQLAEKGMEGRMKSSKAQKPMDEGMFGDAFKQQTLFQSYQRTQTLQRMYDYDLLAKLETLAGYKGEAQKAKREEFLERARTNTLTEADLALKKDVVDAAKRVGGRMFQGSFVGPQFFSAVQRNIEALNQPKGSPDQWAGIIKNLTQKGVKQEEIDWLGVLDWLKEQKGSVTKEQVLEYLRANEVKVQEVVKGDNADKKAVIEELAAYGYEAADMGGLSTSALRTAGVPDALIDRFDKAFITSDETKFEKYVLPGGDNYRELLMTLPSDAAGIPDQIKAINEKMAEANSAERYAEYERLHAERTALMDKYTARDEYRSSHYDEKNVLAHIRFNERTDADGKRTMFIEEVQSDWHQAGRDKGYKNEDIIVPLNQQFAALDRELREAINSGTEDAAVRVLEIQKEQQKIREQMNEAISGVPDAPFKTTWPELAFKRALMWAVENNFDSVSWTTGEQQAARYDLSKQVDRIVVPMVNEGSRSVRIDGKDGGPSFKLMVDDKGVVDSSGSGAQFSGKTLDDVIGKEMAKKVMETKEPTEFSGEGLKVGGEGMKAFYDKMLPSMVNKLVKKWGGKVGATNLNNRRWEAKDYEADNQPSEEELVEANAPKMVHSLEITPAMRESIAKGLPLFQEGARGSITFGRYKTLISLFRNANPSTLLHELGHFFLRDMDRIAKSTRRPMVKKDYEAVKKWLGSKDGKFTEDQEEKFARGFEAYLREGKAPTEGLKPIFARFKDWLTSIYQSVKDLNVEINDDVRGVFDRMLGADYAKVEKAAQQSEIDAMEAMYAQAEKTEPENTFWRDTKNIFQDISDIGADVFTPVTSRLERISPQLKHAVRRFTVMTDLHTQQDKTAAEGFIKLVADKMEKPDYYKLALALNNRNDVIVDQIMKKYGAQKEWESVRNRLDDIFNDAGEVGLDMGYLENYFPRLVRRGMELEYMAFLRTQPQWTELQQALSDADPTNTFTPQEQAEFANKFLRGFTSQHLNVKRPGFTKERNIDIVTNEMQRFYEPPVEALINYISGMRFAIEARQLLGQSEKKLDDSIGKYVLGLAQQGIITPRQEQEIKRILKAILEPRGPGTAVSWIKSIGYIYTMGTSPSSTITQIGDLAFSLAKNGYYRTGKALITAATRQSEFTQKEVGIDAILDEYKDKSRASKFLNYNFKKIGLRGFDMITSETTMNASIARLRSQLKKGGKAATKQMEVIFGDQAPRVIQELMDGKKTEDTLYLAASELLDVAPKAHSELPVGYLRGGNWRMMYMLKTYTIRQIDIYRREVFSKIASGDKEQMIQGTRNLIHLAVGLMLMGMTSDALKDLLFGREVTYRELVIDNLIKLAGITKYQIYKTRQDGIIEGIILSTVIPAALWAPADDLWRDVDKISSGKRKLKDSEILGHVPFIGKLYYWWWGGGRTKEEKKAGKGGKAKETW